MATLSVVSAQDLPQAGLGLPTNQFVFPLAHLLNTTKIYTCELILIEVFNIVFLITGLIMVIIQATNHP